MNTTTSLVKTASEVQSSVPIAQVNDASLLVTSAAIELRDSLIAKSQGIDPVTDVKSQEVAVVVLSEIGGALTRFEADRKALKDPFWKLCKLIDSATKLFADPLDAEKLRLKQMIGDFQTQERLRIEAENRKREAELRRIADEKAKLEREEAERAAAAQREEQMRQQKAAEEMRRASAAEQEKLRQAEQKRQAEMAEKAAREKAEADKRQAELSNAISRNIVPVEAPKAKGIAIKPTIKFRVLDLAKLYAAEPEFVELKEKTAAINAFIRAPGNEYVNIPGIEIYEEVGVTTR